MWLATGSLKDPVSEKQGGRQGGGRVTSEELHPSLVSEHHMQIHENPQRSWQKPAAPLTPVVLTSERILIVSKPEMTPRA